MTDLQKALLNWGRQNKVHALPFLPQEEKVRLLWGYTEGQAWPARGMVTGSWTDRLEVGKVGRHWVHCRLSGQHA